MSSLNGVLYSDGIDGGVWDEICTYGHHGVTFSFAPFLNLGTKNSMTKNNDECILYTAALIWLERCDGIV